MNESDGVRRLRIVISDEETGEEIARATDVETLVLLVAPDALRNDKYRRILLGDPDLSAQLLFDILRDVVERIGRGTAMDLADGLDDHWLLEMTDDLPLH
jgi:hypothetical protein